jgi:hypothetical protein
VGEVPLVEIDHAIAAIDFDNRRNQGDHVVANGFDVGTLVDGQPVGQFH